MSHEGFTAQHRTIGRAAAWAVFLIALVYAIILMLGLLSLKSPQDPIGDPYFDGTAHSAHGTIDGRQHGRSSRVRIS